jgi:acyl-CoA thioester hydrolase
MLCLPVRVYWEDTDAGGIVYHAAYLRFMERARTEWLRARGIDQQVLRQTERLQFAVVDMQVQWHRPARLDAELRVSADLTAAAGASFSFVQAVRRGDELLVSAGVRAAVLHADTMRPRRLPPTFVELFK